MTMRILVTGAKGQLGWELLRQAPDKACDCVGIDIEEADLTDPVQVNRMVADIRPQLLINAAAYTLVDRAQTDPDSAFAVNREAVAHLAVACAAASIPMVHISTDFVFDGTQTDPYTENDPVAPLSVYGQSKAAGETAVRDSLDRHLIIRTAWLYGNHGNNFVKTMLRLGQTKREIQVVSDQVGCPTYAADLAAALLTLAERLSRPADILWGTYHLCGAGEVSWYVFAQHILQAGHRLGLVPAVAVTPISTPEYPTPAPRPAYSALACRKIDTNFGIACPPWEISLEKVLQRLAQHPHEAR